jgi:hypothetical protein
LEADPEAHALAAEILANACKHREMLDGLVVGTRRVP